MGAQALACMYMTHTEHKTKKKEIDEATEQSAMGSTHFTMPFLETE